MLLQAIHTVLGIALTLCIVAVTSSPNPFLLINKGQINVRDSIQRVGHAKSRSNGGKLRYIQGSGLIGGFPEPEYPDTQLYSGTQQYASGNTVQLQERQVNEKAPKQYDHTNNLPTEAYVEQNQQRQVTTRHAGVSHNNYYGDAEALGGSVQQGNFVHTSLAGQVHHRPHVQPQPQAQWNGGTEAYAIGSFGAQSHPPRRRKGLRGLILGVKDKMQNAYQNMRQKVRSMLYKRGAPAPAHSQSRPHSVQNVYTESTENGQGYRPEGFVGGQARVQQRRQEFYRDPEPKYIRCHRWLRFLC